MLRMEEENRKLLKEKEDEILRVIAKCNKEKLELVEEMDGKSSINRASLVQN